MSVIELQGIIDEAGELQVTLPRGLHPGNVKVTIELDFAPDENEVNWEDVPWAQDEIDELMKPNPVKSGAEIAQLLRSGKLDTSAWSEIEDSVSWVENVRQTAWHHNQQ